MNPKLWKPLHVWKWMRSGGFLLLLVSVGAIILRLSISNPVGKELWPGPDAHEYADTARRLAYLEGYGGIDISGVVFPSRYPIFYPLVLVPIVWIWNGDAMHYSQSMAILGGLSVLLTGIFAWSFVKRIEAGVLAALLVALSPCHILHSHFVMSDLVMFILYQLLVLLAFYHCDKAPASLGVIIAGLLVGALLAIRLASIPLVFAGGAFYVLRLRRQWRLLALFVAGGAVFPLLEALNRLVSFGTMLTAGYHYYAPAHWAESGFKLSSFKWIMETEGGERIPNIIYFGRMLVGIDGSLIHAPWALGCLGLLAIILLLARRPSSTNEYLFKVLFLIVGPLGLVLLHLAYYWQGPRMMLSMVFILAVLFVVSLDWVTRQLATRLPLQNAGRQMVNRGLFIVLGIVSLILPAEAAMRARRFPVPTEGFTEQLRKEVRKINSPVFVTNLGVLRCRNLLFPGGAASRTLIVSISDSFVHDEHAFRINLEKPLYPRKPNAALVPTVGRWSSSKQGGSGTLELDQQTLELISNKLGGEEALILLRPDEKAQMVIEIWNANAGWDIEKRGHWGPFEYWSARPRY